jgi:hypothetical protein
LTQEDGDFTDCTQQPDHRCETGHGPRKNQTARSLIYSRYSSIITVMGLANEHLRLSALRLLHFSPKLMAPAKIAGKGLTG